MILILGGRGYVGGAFARYFDQRDLKYRIVGRGDIEGAGGLRRLLELESPEFVVNCAGYTGKPNVDACESHKVESLEGNAVLPGVLQKVLREFRIGWGHVSSGCIFTGYRDRLPDGTLQGFREEDAPNFSFRQNNCSFYSGSKALGEEALGYRETASRDGLTPAWASTEDPDFFIWRLRIPFNEQDSSRNYLSKLMRYARLLEAENSLSQLDEFVRACWECWEKRVPWGIYNVTNPGSVNTRQVTELILAEAESRKLRGGSAHFPEKFDFFRSEEEFMRQAAITPRSNCVLDSSKLAAAGIQMTPVEEAIRRALQNWQPEVG